ncbi:hypothetical protein FAES_pFAES01017 (plasmid) [Fibrella aestuarina BUZ 2]|uniref:Uncharacterized protein n=1 Tax=Fibrella aestuarina BUZ 2 TaxID=1166018 RepID=I0KHA8_9BACT|nr:hypothetical protein FAES_pFAES01017 [Fibrella aestuarina BUZ 2]
MDRLGNQHLPFSNYRITDTYANRAGVTSEYNILRAC